MPSQKKNKNKSKPQQGWVVELKEAEREVKTANQATPKQHLRVARAARKLRIWNKCKTAAEKALSIDLHGPLRAQLVECQKQAEEELSITNEVDSERFKSMLQDVGIHKFNTCTVPHDLFCNLNILQHAAMKGKIWLLEDLVASGIALDYPVSNNSVHDLLPGCAIPGSEPAPKGSTALVLCCAELAMDTWFVKRGGHRPRMSDDEDQDKWASKLVECAILLVKLGADFHRKFILDPPSERNGPLLSRYHRAKIGGKTAQQLAQMAQHPELVKAMEELHSDEKRIALVYCRCGSRLPWKECHAGNNVGESPVYIRSTEDGDRFLEWRYSPLARCPCGHTKKTHYKCCWKESCRPYYLDDNNGGITKQCYSLIGECQREREHDQLLTICQETTAIAKDDHQSHIIKRLEGELFRWTSRHWHFPKAELLVMVKRWNSALQKYCDEAAMTGSHRASVIEKNRATPFAPCGNPSCTNIEIKVKEFSKCSKCKMIAYCSSECQRKGWKSHKGNCHAT